MWWDSLEAEPYQRKARVFEWATGRSWVMPDSEWLLDECADFVAGGKLSLWLDYYNDFAGMD